MLQPLMTVKVTRKNIEAEDIAVFELADPTGGDLPPFSAGSHIDVEVRAGLVRQYSLCNNPSERSRYVIGVLKDPRSRGGSAGMHEIGEGQDLRISEPRNHFQLEHSAQRTLLFAGGIGVTPILCMAERLSALGADFEMHYCARSRARCAFHDRIRASTFAEKVHFHFDDQGQAHALDIDAVLGEPCLGTHVYVCGPTGYIDLVLRSAAAKGYADRQVHREYFSADPEAMFAEGGAFQIKISSTGQVFDIPADATVTDVLRDAGVDLPTSCAQGVCGTCITRVLDGVPEHRDFYLTNEEREKNDQFTPCCSRSKTPMLVIDV
ncbi:flavodoxin reductase family protein [Caulobacter sp. AP07]|uniref:PDR/VanB family oxidoreductase n=1 Tax=Caulobacter sp. AP07 TaxID=1144304 RepID=UPI000271ED61|nr:PDR/VanB family oxidoreductase [Caulobacter sp. AP07]EJL35868.1 flavodoxin reductase family protein [Caulobacter sp. AP07]